MLGSTTVRRRSTLAVAGAHLTPRRFGSHREQVLCTALTAGLAAALLAFGPAPGDAAVHLYRTFLVRHGAFLWDNYWYAGDYPLASYSLVYYLPAALVGNVPLVVGGAVASTLLFASIAGREWGRAAVWPGRLFGICAAAPLFTGLYSYSVAFAAMLGTLRLLQSRRIRAATGLTALTLGLSPLAFAFLCLILLAVFAARRHAAGDALRVGAALGALAVVELVVLRLFPSDGVYPFHLANLVGVVGVCSFGVLLARRADNARVLVWFFVVWGLTSVLFWTMRTPIGGNWTRLGEFCLPLMLVAALQSGFRPRWLVAVALAGAFAYTITPNLMLIPYRLDNRPAAERFWRPALSFLQRHSRPGYRVEVVPTAAHWESYWIPRSGFALARGWYRQLDVVDNPALYSKRLDAATYRSWLRSEAIEYILLPATKLDPVGAAREARIVRSRSVGLVVAFRSRDWTIYRLPAATPLITGPGRVTVTSFDHTTISGSISKAGRYLLRTHYIPFWEPGTNVCVRRGPARMTWLDVSAAGAFSLRVAPAARALLRAASIGSNHSCHAADRRR